jgi:hypothetical protein
MTGDHTNCDNYYCKDMFRERFPKISFKNEAIKALSYYLDNYASRGDKLTNLTSNIVESFFSINCRF